MNRTSVFDITTRVRPNIRAMKPYSSARDEFHGDAEIFLDANENPYPTGFNRYPDPLQRKLKEKIAAMRKVSSGQIFLGNGSDEAIDLLIRAFCEPNTDTIVTTDPTYGMYSVCAAVNAVGVRTARLQPDFDLDAEALLNAADGNTKIIFLCSPNNPTGNSLTRKKIHHVLSRFDGLVVVDEAYIDFSGSESMINDLRQYPNLVVLQTFSKAWGLAGLRLGMAFASEPIVAILNKIKYPYNINTRTQEIALEALENESQKEKWVTAILKERETLAIALDSVPAVRRVFPSDANFLLVQVDDAPATYAYLVKKGIIVRDRSRVTLCEGCLRITVGTPQENKSLIEALRSL